MNAIDTLDLADRRIVVLRRAHSDKVKSLARWGRDKHPVHASWSRFWPP